MGGDDTDVVGCGVDYLHLAGGSSGEGDRLLRQAAEAEEVIGSLVCGKEVRRLGERVDADAVLQDDHDAVPGQLDAADGGEGGDLEGDLALGLVP